MYKATQRIFQVFALFLFAISSVHAQSGLTAIDGNWYSTKWKYGYTLQNGVGTATSTNSPNFKVGQNIIQLTASSSNTFSGRQIYTDGKFYSVKATLQSDGRLYFEGEKNAKWVMERVSASSQQGFQFPLELQGTYAYPNRGYEYRGNDFACPSNAYDLRIRKDELNANEFNCKIIGKPTGTNGRYTIPVQCSSESGSKKSNVLIDLNDRDSKLTYDKVEYVRCAPDFNQPVQTVKAKLPNFCRDEDLIGGPKKIYNNKELTRLNRDMDSGGYVFTPHKELKVGGKTVYEGSVSILRNGRDVQGIYFIDANEWANVCK